MMSILNRLKSYPQLHLPLILIAGFLVRLISLGQSLWLDEGTTAKVAMKIPYLKILTQFSPTDFHPPLYYFLIKFWTGIFGSSEISLRMPSVIFSLLAGLFVYKIGKRLKDKTAGLWASAFFLFNPLIVYYSQEARMYMMATFFLAVSLFYFFGILSSPKKTGRIGVLRFGIFSSLAFATFYGSVFMIAATMMVLLWKKKFRPFAISLLILTSSFLILSPLLYQQLANSREALKAVANWRNVLGTANLKNLLLIPIKFTGGRISFEPKTIYYALAGLWALIVFIPVFISGSKNKDVFYIFIFSILVGLFFSFFTPLLQYFRFLYLIPLMALLLGLKGEYKHGRESKIKAMLLAGFVLWSFAYLLLPQFHREDWKSLAKNIDSAKSVYVISSSSDPLLYYNSQLPIRDLRNIANGELPKNLTIIPYTSEIFGFDYAGILRRKGFGVGKRKFFRQLVEEEWVH